MRYIIPTFLLFAVLACSTSSDIKNTISSARNLMQDHPDSALCLLEAIDPSHIYDSETQALYSLYYSQALDKNYIELKSDSIISPAIQYYDKHGNAGQKALSYFYLGQIYLNADSLEMAMNAFLHAEANMHGLDDPHLSGLLYNRMGTIYQQQHEFDRSIEMHQKSLDFRSLAGDKMYEMKALGHLASVYYLKKDGNENAIFYFNKARNLAIELNSVENILTYSYSIASIYHQSFKNPDFALNEIYKTVNTYNNGIVPPRYRGLLGYIYIQQEKYDSAKYHLTTYLSEAADQISANQKAGLNLMLKEIELKRGNYEEAFHYYDEYTEASTLFYNQKHEQSIIEIEEKFRNEQLRASVVNLKKQQTYQGIIGGLLIVILTGTILITEKNRRNSLKQKNRQIGEYELFVEQLQKDNERHQEVQAQLSETLNQKNTKEAALKSALDGRLHSIQKILDLASIHSNSPEIFYNKFKQHIWNHKDENAFVDLQEVVNSKYYGFVDYIKREYPLLNKEDIDLCCLLTFGFSAAQICIIYDYTNYNSIYVRRHKLRKKMRITTPEMNIETHIKQIIAELKKINS